jgi:uncharacterized protein YlxW (UPF0749 family)
MDNITQRNIQALSQGLNQLHAKVSDLEFENKNLRATLIALQNQVNTMATVLAMLRVKALGSGPTT